MYYRKQKIGTLNIIHHINIKIKSNRVIRNKNLHFSMGACAIFALSHLTMRHPCIKIINVEIEMEKGCPKGASYDDKKFICSYCPCYKAQVGRVKKLRQVRTSLEGACP